jgi:hypothetical protein
MLHACDHLLNKNQVFYQAFCVLLFTPNLPLERTKEVHANTMTYIKEFCPFIYSLTHLTCLYILHRLHVLFIV